MLHLMMLFGMAIGAFWSTLCEQRMCQGSAEYHCMRSRALELGHVQTGAACHIPCLHAINIAAAAC